MIEDEVYPLSDPILDSIEPIPGDQDVVKCPDVKDRDVKCPYDKDRDVKCPDDKDRDVKYPDKKDRVVVRDDSEFDCSKCVFAATSKAQLKSHFSKKHRLVKGQFTQLTYFILTKLGFLLKFGVLFKFLIQLCCIVSNCENQYRSCSIMNFECLIKC
jgi:hypothetical protein